ncbi:hypothetical protein ACHAW5_008412 [Stephanodiscus triporus]|uniref:Uncharacterized protein n=1 Tax=Stephanodiscus triporus TaxID=2934178 RepID=A0ABD3MQJ8_9STRA
MKRLTYLTNDSTSVHRFTSLATTQVRRARDVDIAVAETRNRYAGSDVIESGFAEANGKEVLPFVVALVPGDEEEKEEKEGSGNNNNGRTHPSKKGVFPVWDLPLLPDARTWGNTITHVVIDNPSRNARGGRTSSSSGCGRDGENNDDLPGVGRLVDAIVADVSRQAHNARMECTVWVPTKETTSAGKKSRRSSAGGGRGGGGGGGGRGGGGRRKPIGREESEGDDGGDDAF